MHIILDVAYSKEELDEKEIFWIAERNSLAPNGYNLKTGGNGGGKHSEETKKKISENSAMKIPEVRAKISKANKGKKHSEETKKKISENSYMRGKIGALHHNAKEPILVVHAKTGEFVSVWHTTKDIERELESTKGNKLFGCNVSSVLTGKYKSYGGYFFVRLYNNEWQAYL